MEHFLLFKLLLTLIFYLVISLRVNSQLLWTSLARNVPEPEKLTNTISDSLSNDYYSQIRQPSLLELCLSMKNIWGKDKLSEYIMQSMCDAEIIRKRGERRENYPSYWRSDGAEVNKRRRINIPYSVENIKKRALIHFGGIHKNVGGEHWNPQVTTIHNLQMGGANAAIHKNVGAEHWNPQVTAAHNHQVGNANAAIHKNIGGEHWNPQVTAVHNLQMGNANAAIHKNVGEEHWNPQVTAVHNLQVGNANDGYNTYGPNNDGYNSHGYDNHGYDNHGYDNHEYNNDGYNNHGYNNDGYVDPGHWEVYAAPSRR